MLILLLGCPQNAENNIEQGVSSDYYELDIDTGIFYSAPKNDK